MFLVFCFHCVIQYRVVRFPCICSKKSYQWLYTVHVHGRRVNARQGKNLENLWESPATTTTVLKVNRNTLWRIVENPECLVQDKYDSEAK